MSRKQQAADLRKERFAIADRIIATGGNLRRFSEAAHLSDPGGLKWLRANDPDRLALLVAGRARNRLSAHQALVRLLLIQTHRDSHPRGVTRLAEALGCSLEALSKFEARWAPDGIEAAVIDLWPDSANGKSSLTDQLKSMFPRPVHEVAHG